MLTISEATLNIQARLAEAPAWLRRLVGPARRRRTAGRLVAVAVLRPRCCGAARASDSGPLITAEQVTAAIDKAEALGADTTCGAPRAGRVAATARNTQRSMALFGEISSGKSALAQALLPQ